MPLAPTKLGPFKSGLVNVVDVTTVPDDALVECTNFDFDINGFLLSRPPIVPITASPVAGEPIDILGTYVTRDGVVYLVVVTNTKTWLYTVGTGAWTQIWANRASSFCQYDNKVVMISTTVAGGYWEAGSFVATPTMPLGQQIVFYQERFWAFGARNTVDSTTIWFSNINVVSPAQSIYDWQPTSNFFTVSRGDGQWITGLLPDTNGLIIFRSSSTAVFSFPSSPLTGTLRFVSSTTGTDNQFTFQAYEDYYLVLNQGYLYQFINYRFYPLNTKRVDFGGGSFVHARRYDLRLSIFGERCIIFYEGALWVYSISLNTWSKWQSTTSAGTFVQVPPSATTGNDRIAYVAAAEDDSTKYGLYRITETQIAAGATGEEMVSSITTKTYNQEQPSDYKRMSYWVVEATTARGLESIASPTALSTEGITFDDLDLTTFDVMDKGSFDNPIIVLPVIEDNITFPAAAPIRAVFRCIKDMRYLSITYQVKMGHDGTAATAPVKIFSITPYVRIHGAVSKKVS